MKAFVKTKRIGGSIMVRVPKEIVEAEGIGENQMVELDVKKAKVSGFGILKGLGPFTKEDELDTHD